MLGLNRRYSFCFTMVLTRLTLFPFLHSPPPAIPSPPFRPHWRPVPEWIPSPSALQRPFLFHPRCHTNLLYLTALDDVDILWFPPLCTFHPGPYIYLSALYRHLIMSCACLPMWSTPPFIWSQAWVTRCLYLCEPHRGMCGLRRGWGTKRDTTGLTLKA